MVLVDSIVMVRSREEGIKRGKEKGGRPMG
jgi:hypothetical protein